MTIQILRKWFEKPPIGSLPSNDRSAIRVGIPKVLNVWSTHQFWIGFLTALGIRFENIVFSRDSSEEQYREFGKGRGVVDCCYPVKVVSGHYGELIFGQKKRIHFLLSPMIYSIPSILKGHVTDTLTCPRVMAASENIKSGFLKEHDVFAENRITYVSPFVSLGEPTLVARQLFESLKDLWGLDRKETEKAVESGYKALETFNQMMRQESGRILQGCAERNKPCLLVLGRPYHMDSGIGHEIEADLQAYGYPILWMQYLPIEENLMDWLFGQEVRNGQIDSPFDISDVWVSSYSGNTNEILWGAKFAARCPWITGVIHLSSYECGMDQPTYTPTQKIVETSGTLFFKFGDLDATKPAGSVRIRIETIGYYLEKFSSDIIETKRSRLEGSSWYLQKPDVDDQT